MKHRDGPGRHSLGRPGPAAVRVRHRDRNGHGNGHKRDTAGAAPPGRPCCGRSPGTGSSVTAPGPVARPAAADMAVGAALCN
jgi:hypothetical protein